MSSHEPWQPTRDLLGYGQNPPDPKWPNGARIAINFVMNYEEGSEPSVQDGEGFSETGLTESTTSQAGDGSRAEVFTPSRALIGFRRSAPSSLPPRLWAGMYCWRWLIRSAVAGWSERYLLKAGTSPSIFCSFWKKVISPCGSYPAAEA